MTEKTTLFRTADEDYAVVIGIGAYPTIHCLHGPVKDARDFEAWLLSSAGGCVPKDNIAVICSPDFPPIPTIDKATPTKDKVDSAFADLVGKALKHPKYRAGGGSNIFMAGHGIAPLSASENGANGNGANGDDEDDAADQTALLMANYRSAAPGLHVGARNYAEWFRKVGAFDEVILFVDCCRDESGSSPAPILSRGWSRGAHRRAGCMRWPRSSSPPHGRCRSTARCAACSATVSWRR